jgi:alpha-amylase
MKKQLFYCLMLMAGALMFTVTSCSDDDNSTSGGGTDKPEPTDTITSHEPSPAVATATPGWPGTYGGVMLQGFYWDSYDDTNWLTLVSQADNLAGTFDLVWLPQSGNCGGTSMGYDDLYWFSNYSSSFGTETQLRSLINTFKAKGIKTIADVVINHRKSNNGWFGFPSETYKGVTYSMSSKDVCSNDDNGKAQAEANRLGVELGNADTGEGWDGMRDLDHKSENVQTIVKAYLDFLKNDLGYAGFRYDMVKGYSASFTGKYNVSSRPEFSVGECWDGTQTIRNWIEGTKSEGNIQSAAFDFQFRYTVRNAMNNGNYAALASQNDGNWPLVSNDYFNGQYRHYAVTFVENHDTEKRKDSAQDPLKKDTLAANAYLLAMPGTPCVFYTHWKAYPTEIKAMAAVRKYAGIHNESSYTNFATNTKYYANVVDDKLLVVVGDVTKAASGIDITKWVRVLSGHHYAYYLPAYINAAYVDLPSSTYTEAQTVKLIALTAHANANLVYTTDGSNPTANSTKVASGATVSIPVGTTTLKVGLLINGKVIGIATRNYVVKETPKTEVVIPDFCEVKAGETCAFFEAPATWTETIMCWAWIDNGSNFTGGTWPGLACTKLGTASNGNTVWKWTYTGTLTTKPQKIIFSNGSEGKPQTDDFSFKNGGYYTRDGLFGTVNTQ